MMLLNILLIAYCAGLVSSQDDTYDKEKHTIDLDEFHVSNRDDCGSKSGDMDLFEDFSIVEANVVNVTETRGCPSPIGSTPVKGLSGSNIFYDDGRVLAFQLTGVNPFNPEKILSSASFSVSVDLDSLDIDSKDFVMELELGWTRNIQSVGSETRKFSFKRDGPPPYRVDTKRIDFQADGFQITASIFDDEEFYVDYNLAVFNVEFDILTRKVDNNDDDDDDDNDDDPQSSSATSSSVAPGQSTAGASSTSSDTTFTSSRPGAPPPTATASDSDLPTAVEAPTSTSSTPDAAQHLSPEYFGFVAALVAAIGVL